jgi:hypothetical protein
MEISNDGSNWTEIAHRVYNSDLNGDRLIGVYSISGQVPESRFVPPRPIGKNHCGSDHLKVSGFELFRLCAPDDDIGTLG